jgi:thiol-disulfide isomerase/thioredoxin
MMKKFGALGICVLFLFSCQTNLQRTILEPGVFEAALARVNVQLLDLRSPVEFQAGHIKNALQADWNNQVEFREYAVHIYKNEPLYIYSDSDTTTGAASAWLMSEGFKVSELKGGLSEWLSAGKEVTKSETEKPLSMGEYKILTNLGAVVLVDIGAEWCPPCKKMDPVIEKLKIDLGENLKVVKIDATVQSALMKGVGAEKLPTFIIYKNGGETWRKEGIVSLQELKRNLR